MDATSAGNGRNRTAALPRPRDEELSRLRKENKMLKEANEILKKAVGL
ncbi:MAG: hypothetical protein LBG24_01120 [Treponema sp.]|nr:hypothetical protein [Treponema sp.]